MMAVYGVNVLDPSVSLRRIHVLARRLPIGSMPLNELASWSTETHLLARLNDAIDLLTFVVLKLAGSKSVEKPKPIERPGHAKQGKTRGQQMKWGELGGFLKAQGVVNGR